MPVKPPVMPRTLNPQDIGEIAAHAQEVIEDAAFVGGALEDIAADTLDFSGCRFTGVRFCECDVDRIYFTDCLFEKCDLSGFRPREGMLRRVAFQSCRAAGTRFDRMNLRDVTFDECMLDYAVFAECRLQDVRVAHSRMKRILLHSCTQKGLVLEDCDMEEAEIIATRLNGVDLSTCGLDGLHSSIDLFRGAIINLQQSPQLLGLCEIAVKL